MTFEYLVVPAPRRAPRIKGVRSPADRFAMAVAEVMNEAGREGWEYLRTDTLPMEASGGWLPGWLSGRQAAPQELLVFRRPLGAEARDDEAVAPPARGPAASASPAPLPAFSRGAPLDRASRERAAAEAPPARAAAITPLSPRPAPPRGPSATLGAPRDALGEPPPRSDPDGTRPGPPRLGGARRD